MPVRHGDQGLVCGMSGKDVEDVNQYAAPMSAPTAGAAKDPR